MAPPPCLLQALLGFKPCCDMHIICTWHIPSPTPPCPCLLPQALLEADPEDDSYAAQACARLAGELELALADGASLAHRLAAADAVIVQQQAHITCVRAELHGAGRACVRAWGLTVGGSRTVGGFLPSCRRAGDNGGRGDQRVI